MLLVVTGVGFLITSLFVEYMRDEEGMRGFSPIESLGCSD